MEAVKLFKTERINTLNLVEAVKALNEIVQEDRKLIQTLQEELAKRDTKLLEELRSLKKTTHNGFQQVNEQIGSLRHDLNEQVGSLRHDLNEQVGSLRAEISDQTDLLRQIAFNTQSKD